MQKASGGPPLLQLFTEDPQLDRRQLLNEAQRARTRGRYRRAITLYQYALAREPDSVELAARVAPLLAFEGRHFEAWRHFRTAGRALIRQRRHEWALSLFREATRCLPLEFEAWRITAEIERKLGHSDLAFETLLEGRSQFRSPLQRDEAITLLQLAREIEPYDADVVTDLAQLLARSDQVVRALEILEAYIPYCDDYALRRVRAAQWRITRAPQDLWHLAASYFSGNARRRGRDGRSDAAALFEGG